MRAIVMTILCLASTCALPTVLRGQSSPAPAASKPAKPTPPTATSSPTTVACGQFNARVHKEEGKSLPYQLLVPKDYAPNTKKVWPLVVWLHGSGENGTDNRAQLKAIAKTFLGDGAKTRAFVLAPQAPPGLAWHGVGMNKQPEVTEPSRMLIALIAELQKEFKLDDRRISVGGFSMGGCGTWELTSRYPNVFAASFAIAGGPGDRPALAPLIKDIPVWVFHGDNDNTGTPEDSRQIVKAIKEQGGSARYTEYAGGTHECHTALAEPELPEWLLAQKRKAPADFTLAKVPDAATMILKTLPQGTHGTWTGPVRHTGHGVARIAIDGVRYRLRPAAKADGDVAALVGRIGKGEIAGTCQVTGTVEIEDLAWIAVEQIDIKK